MVSRTHHTIRGLEELGSVGLACLLHDRERPEQFKVQREKSYWQDSCESAFKVLAHTLLWGQPLAVQRISVNKPFGPGKRVLTHSGWIGMSVR
jgi:hypothetical protein